MFATRETCRGRAGVAELAFTDRLGGVSDVPFDELDLKAADASRKGELASNLALVAAAFDVSGFVTMKQVHGSEVCVVGSSPDVTPTCDALVTVTPGVALCVRVADCVPVICVDIDNGVLGVAHAGRSGVSVGIVPAMVETMRALGARDVEAWIGPHICGGCYEVPATMREAGADVAPAAFACTTWGSPSLDLGAAVSSQLRALDCQVHDVSRCTRESPDLYSYRRDGDASGRMAGVAVLRGPDHE